MSDNAIVYAPSSGTTVRTEEEGGAHYQVIVPGGIESTNNKTTTPLNAGNTYTGTWELNSWPDTLVVCKTDQAGTLIADFSPDGTNVDSSLSFKVAANSNEFHILVKGPRYFRIRFENTSASNQTFIRLYCYHGTFNKGTSPLNSTIAQDADALIVRSLTEELTIGEGKMAGYSTVNKAGKNPDIDTGSVPEDIWGNSGTYTGWATSAETLQVFSSDANDTSAGTGARTVRIVGLDANYNVISETVTLNGTTPATTSNSFLRAHTMRVVSAGSGGKNAGTITVRQSTTTANIMLFMLAGINQTNDVGYTIPAGKTGYLRRFRVQVLSNNAGAVNGAILIREFGEIFRERRPFTASNTSYYVEDIYGGLTIPEKSDVIMRVTSATANNLVVTGGYDLVVVDN